MGGVGGRLRQCVLVLIGCVVFAVLIAQTGCTGGSVAPPQSAAQDRLANLMNLYRLYVEKTKKPPPNEEALREFHKSLSAQERTDRLIGNGDIEELFSSPRDKQKFNVKYNIKPEPAVNRALAWETTGQNGLRWVALTNGYTVEYDDQQLKDVMK